MCIRDSGTGVWGEIPMPVNAVISLDDAKAAVKYILMLRNKSVSYTHLRC